MVEVSVIIPSYSRPTFLYRAAKSVLAQTFSDWEMIIVDDNGRGTEEQNNTAEILEPFLSDKRVQYLILERNSGGSVARNVGWQAAKGKYICFLDNDDEFYPQKLEIQYNALEKSGHQVSVCRFESYKNGRKARISPKIEKCDSYLIPFFQGRLNFASGSTLMVSKEILRQIGGYDEAFRRKQDVELMVRLLAVEKLFIEERVLVRLNIDDRTNIPKVEIFKRTQSLFNAKFTELFESFPKEEQSRIIQYNLIELSKVALWNKDIREFLRVFFISELTWKNKVGLLRDLTKKFITYYVR